MSQTTVEKMSTRDSTLLRALTVATFVVILNETIMINAIPLLMDALHVTARDAQWLSAGFMLTMAVVIPVTGWFLGRVTTRAAFATAMGLFCAGTLLAGFAPTFSVLLVARVVQAAGTAVMLPLLMTTLLTVVPPTQRGRVMGNVTLVISVAPAMGPALSGVILQFLTWRWLFLLVLPVAVLLAAWGLRVVRNSGESQPGSLDVLSVVLTTIGFGSLVYGLSQVGGEASQPLLPPWVLLLVGVVALAAFALRQLRLQRVATPLLDLRTLRQGGYANALALMALAFMGLMGAMILLPLYLQQVRGLSTLATGLMLMPGGLAMGLLGPTVGRLYDRRGAHPLVVPGAAAMVLALALMAVAASSGPVWVFLPLHVLLTIGLAFVFTPVFTAGLAFLPPHLYSHGSAMLGTLQQVAAAAGTALVVTVMTTRAAQLTEDGVSQIGAMTGGVQMALGVGALIAVGVLVLAFRQPTPPAEAGAHVSEDVAEIDSDAGPDVAEFEQEFSDHALETCGCAAGGGSECARA
ncbi:MAG TPA: DHA2 family efflux MFS transporter permease subunit [Nocardioidaceae bacterium]|nr:DHA2 family efflux MFS transporter permease subunit [Nocardioidaceae bacterium]